MTPEEKVLHDFKIKVQESQGISVEAFYLKITNNYHYDIKVTDFKDILIKYCINMTDSSLE